MFEEFKKFILRGNVIDLAVGVVIGAAFKEIVDALVKYVFMPVVGVLIGGRNFNTLELPLYGDAKMGIGFVITAIVNFLIIGFCLFMVVKVMNKLQKKKEEAPAPPAPSETYLKEIRDLLAKK